MQEKLINLFPMENKQKLLMLQLVYSYLHLVVFQHIFLIILTGAHVN